MFAFYSAFAQGGELGIAGVQFMGIQGFRLRLLIVLTMDDHGCGSWCYRCLFLRGLVFV